MKRPNKVVPSSVGPTAPPTVFARTVAAAKGTFKAAIAALQASVLSLQIAVMALQNMLPVPLYGRTTSTFQGYLNHTQMLWAGDFGVVGDGVADDTVAMQAALNASATYNRVLYCGTLVIKISGALVNANCVGIFFEQTGFGNASDPGIYVTGTGYTALSIIGGSPKVFQVSIYGTGNTCNGLYLDNPVLVLSQFIRVYNLDGFGVKIDTCYDCLFLDTSVELCGNSTNYAFSVNDGPDTSNMSHWVRLQVEQANLNAIFVSPNSISCIFDNIHSERATVAGSGVPPTDSTWVLGGASCTFNNVRCTGLTNAGYVWLRGADSVYICLRVESSLTTVLEGTSTTSITLIQPNLTGTVEALAGQSGILIIEGGNIATIEANWAGTTAQRVILGAGAQLKTGALYPGVGVQPTAVVVNVGASVAIGDAATVAFLLAVDDGGECAILALIPGNTVLVATGAGSWSTVSGTAAHINVFWNGVSFELQNNTGSNRAFYLTYVGNPTNM